MSAAPAEEYSIILLGQQRLSDKISRFYDHILFVEPFIFFSGSLCSAQHYEGSFLSESCILKTLGLRCWLRPCRQ